MLPLAEIVLSWESVGTGVAILAAGSAWFYLPKQVDALEKIVDAHEAEIKRLTADHATSNNKLGELTTAIEFMREQLKKIAEKLNVS